MLLVKKIGVSRPENIKSVIPCSSVFPRIFILGAIEIVHSLENEQGSCLPCVNKETTTMQFIIIAGMWCLDMFHDAVFV